MKQDSPAAFSAMRGRHLLVALSGGADSVALMCMLADAREPLHITLSAAHIDHSIRGEESRRDMEFCRGLCERLNVPFYTERIDVPGIARESGEGLELAARRLRYESLRRFREEANADFIALAHHLDDQAETVLMHLLRGCGPDGICGMRVLEGDLYRPLLNIPKRTLMEYLSGRGISWCEDSTNAEAFTPRNALRLNALPALEEIYPQAASAIARYAEAAQCDNRLLEKLTDAFFEAHAERGAYGMRILRPEETEEAVLRRCIRRICGNSLPHPKLAELILLCGKKRGRLEISGALTAERMPGAIYFLPKQRFLPEPVPLRDGAALTGLGRLSMDESAAVPVRNDPLRQVLRRDALENAVLRTRRDGDRIRPLGCGDRLLSDYLTDKKIDRPLRDCLPLVTVGNRVLWAIGVGIAEDAKLTSPADDAVLLEWRPQEF